MCFFCCLHTIKNNAKTEVFENALAKNNFQLLNEAEKDMKNSADRGRGLSTEAEGLHILRKPNSITVLLFLQNSSIFKNKLKHANHGRCKFISIMHLYREV